MKKILLLLLLPFLCAACAKGNDEGSGAPETPPVTPPETPEEPVDYTYEGDLTVCYIKRLPEIQYVENSSDPAVEGWPAAGQEITWRAYIRNYSLDTARNVTYEFRLNGAVVESGTIPKIAPEKNFPVDYNTTWIKQRDKLAFTIDPESKIEEEEKANNTLEICTDAITVNFYVERGLYDYFHKNQKKLGVGTNCWEDWAQHLMVKRWNKMLEEAVYPDAPDGALDRIRIDSIAVVMDNALPLYGGLASNNPNMRDKTVDLQWGFASATIYSTDNFYKNVTEVSDENPFFFEGSLFHELGHARYLIDQYGFDVSAGGNKENIRITEDGELVAGSKYMPFKAWDVVHYRDYDGLMANGYTYIGEYNVVCLNRIAGRRALCGNMNAPCNIGEYINDLPQQNRLTLKDQDGNTLPDAGVKIYRATGVQDSWYGKYYDDVPDMTLQADGNGVVELGRNPFTTGRIEHTYGIANGVAIVRVEKDGRVGYGFLESSHFNMEYWRGNTAVGNYTMEFNMIQK